MSKGSKMEFCKHLFWDKGLCSCKLALKNMVFDRFPYVAPKCAKNDQFYQILLKSPITLVYMKTLRCNEVTMKNPKNLPFFPCT